MGKEIKNTEQGRKKRTQAQEVWHQLKKNKGAMIGLAIIVAIVLATVLAHFFWIMKRR